MTPPRSPGPKPRLSRGAAVSIVIGGFLIVAIAAGVITAVLLVGGSGGADAVEPTTTPSLGVLDPSAVEQLDARLTSGDQEEVAAALALDPREIPAGVVDGFAGADIDYRTDEAEPFESGWNVPATMTEADGTESEWTVTIIESPDGLVFLDSVPVE